MAKGNVQVTLTAKDEASAKLKKIQQHSDWLKTSFKEMGIAAAAAAAAIAAAATKMLTDWSTAGDEVMKMSQRTGWGVKSLSELNYIAKLSGTSLGEVERSTKKLSQSIVDAGDGMLTYVRDFDKLGLSIEDLRKMEPEEQFWAVAMAIANLEDPTLRSAIAMRIMGESGTNLLPMLAMGAEGIAANRQAANDMGLVWDEVSGTSAVEFKDAFTNVQSSVDGLVYAVAEELGPVIVSLVNDEILPAIADLRKFIKENDDLKQAFLDVAAAIRYVITGIQELYAWYKKIDDAVPDWLKTWARESNPARVLSGANIAEHYGEYRSGISELYQPGRLSEMMPTTMSATGGDVMPAVNVTINGNVMSDEAGIRQLVAALEPYFSEAQRRTSFPQVNTSGYFGGSSSK